MSAIFAALFALGALIGYLATGHWLGVAYGLLGALFLWPFVLIFLAGLYGMVVMVS